MPTRPHIHDEQLWRQQLLEHRRALLERLIEEFPAVLATQRSKVEHWRTILSGPRRA
jgi:uncharacterized coiled-coil protein SlyX